MDMNVFEILISCTQVIGAIAIAVVFFIHQSRLNDLETDLYIAIDAQDDIISELDDLCAYARHERKGKRKRKNQNRKVIRTDVEYEDVLPEDEEDEVLREF